MIKKNSFKYEELIECANGKLFGPGNAKLPSPPMLMFHRITNVSEDKGKFNKGLIEAELDILLYHQQIKYHLLTLLQLLLFLKFFSC